ncbi:LPXTG cell wall anchor domain-containing protein, partial [Bacillus subtilis]
YKDGTIVEWTGDDDADTPHAITSIVDAAKLGHETVDAHGASTKQNAAAENEDSQGGQGIQTASLILSILAVLLGGAALLLTVRKKKS